MRSPTDARLRSSTHDFEPRTTAFPHPGPLSLPTGRARRLMIVAGATGAAPCPLVRVRAAVYAARTMTADAVPVSSATQRQIASRRAIALWLFGVCALLVAMIVLGGVTRRTAWGLSITEWKPIHGALPPLSDREWSQEFDAYKAIPQYQRVNSGMTLDEFKDIFWWEWSHRNLGRFIGFAFLIPFLAFAFLRRIEPALYPRLVLLFFLGGLQGVLGWFMVMSGLQNRVEVSQYRLVAHLGLAVAIYAAMLWTALPLWRGEWPAHGVAHPMLRWALAIVALVYVQMLLGGFVAGLHAGLIYNTWPLMGGRLLPAELFAY